MRSGWRATLAGMVFQILRRGRPARFCRGREVCDAQLRGLLALLGCLLGLGMDGVASVGADWSGVMACARPAVVRVVAETRTGTVCGSGVVVSPDGYVLTAAHVIEDAQSIRVVLEGERAYDAVVVRVHEQADVSLVQIPAVGLMSLCLGSAAALADGEEVYVLGYPGCQPDLTAVLGTVRANVEGERMETIWYNVPVEGGYSGGPVLNRCGEVVAIHFEQPVAEGGGRGVTAETARSLFPSIVVRAVSCPTSHAGSSCGEHWVEVSEPVEPGHIVEADPLQSGRYRLARGLCPIEIGGVVVAVRPDDLGSWMAHVLSIGIVAVKVNDEGGPIVPGDLLIVSSAPGEARRWDPNTGSLCGLVGKALEAHPEGAGVLPVLLMGWDDPGRRDER